jgi:hypothetical protein
VPPAPVSVSKRVRGCASKARKSVIASARPISGVVGAGGPAIRPSPSSGLVSSRNPLELGKDGGAHYQGNPDWSARAAESGSFPMGGAWKPLIVPLSSGPTDKDSQNKRITPMLNHIITRFSLSAGHLRLGLALISLVALVLGGSAGGHWD